MNYYDADGVEHTCAVVADVPKLLLADDDDGTLTVWRSPLVKHSDDICRPVVEWLRAAPYERVSETTEPWPNDQGLWYGCVETVYRRCDDPTTTEWHSLYRP